MTSEITMQHTNRCPANEPKSGFENCNKIFKRTFFSIYCYTILYALFGVLSLSYHSCFNSSLSSLEKRYHFSSSTASYIMTTDNIATVLTNLFIGFYGKTAHKPRWMAIGCIVTGSSIILTAVPYFIYGSVNEQEMALYANATLSKNHETSDSREFCNTANADENCTQMQATKLMTMVAVACFAVSNFFRGFGTSIYFTYGTPYLDDNVSKAKMPLFFAFTFAARIFGSPIGYVISFYSLRLYENPLAPPPDMDYTDPRWVGAWWLGFVFSGFFMLLLAFPLAFFPREFEKRPPTTDIESSSNDFVRSAQDNHDIQIEESKQLALIEDQRENEAKPQVVDQAPSQSLPLTESSALKDKTKTPDMSLLNLPYEIYAIISNPLIICQMSGALFKGIGLIGFYVFQAKYMEAQFKHSASKSSLITGTTGILAKVGGVLIGGLLISVFKPRARYLTTFLFCLELAALSALLLGSTVVGPQYNYPGTTINSANQITFDKDTACNKECHCDITKFQPICNPETSDRYFSPCHAGCSFKTEQTDKNATYSDCKCIQNTYKIGIKCVVSEDQIYKYARIIAVGSMFAGATRAGGMVTFLRSVEPTQKSLAIAVLSFWHSLFVSIPYPIIYGRIFDWACQFWSFECSKRGNCWQYDATQLRHVYHGVSIVLMAIGITFDLVMVYLSPRLGDLYGDSPVGDAGKLFRKLKFWNRQAAIIEPLGIDEKKKQTENNNSETKITNTDASCKAPAIELKNFVENKGDS